MHIMKNEDNLVETACRSGQRENDFLQLDNGIAGCQSWRSFVRRWVDTGQLKMKLVPMCRGDFGKEECRFYAGRWLHAAWTNAFEDGHLLLEGYGFLWITIWMDTGSAKVRIKTAQWIYRRSSSRKHKLKFSDTPRSCHLEGYVGDTIYKAVSTNEASIQESSMKITFGITDENDSECLQNPNILCIS
jgi:hypothetical protein